MNLDDIKPHELVKHLPSPRPFIAEKSAQIIDSVNRIETLKADIEAERGHLAFLQGVFEDAVINDYTDEQIEAAKRKVLEEAVAAQHSRKA